MSHMMENVMNTCRENELELQTKAFVTDLLAGVNTDEDLLDIIRYIMEGVGMYTHSDMVCIYESRTDQDGVNTIYRWKADKTFVEEAVAEPQQQWKSDMWADSLKENKIVVIEDCENIRGETPAEYDRLVQQGIHSLLMIPMYTADRLHGAMRLVNPEFSAFAVMENILLYLGRQLGTLYHRDRVSHKYMLFMDGIRSANLSEFIVDYEKQHYEAYRITKVLQGQIPEEGEWEWIRQFYASIIKPEYKEDFLRKTEREYLETFLCTEQSSFAIDLEREVQGSSTWFRLELTVVSLDENGHLSRFVVQVKDITKMKQEEKKYQRTIKKMQYKIEHDELTGTLSRAAFNGYIEELEDSEEPFAFVLLDIDKFKTINDTYGHDVGDAVLSCLTSVLNREIGTSGRLFRLGGDEFAIIMNRLTPEKADSVKQLIEAVNVLITSGVDGLPGFSISAGVTFSDSGYQEILYRNADQALYHTKETMRRGCTVFEELK